MKKIDNLTFNEFAWRKFTSEGSHEWTQFANVDVQFSQFVFDDVGYSLYTLSDFKILDIGELRTLELSDTFSVDDIVGVTFRKGQLADDSFGTTDTLTLAVLKGVSDIVGVGDYCNITFVSGTVDSFSATDSLEMIVAKGFTENASASDTFSKKVTKNFYDVVAVDDSLDFSFGTTITKSNVATVSDTLTKAVTRPLTDTFFVGDTLQLIITKKVNSTLGKFRFGGAMFGE